MKITKNMDLYSKKEMIKIGFDIYALNENGKEIAYLHAYMGAFRMLYEQGYDWFELIDAYDCYGGVSGNGKSKQILLTNLENAMKILETYNPQGKLSSEGRDEFSYRKPILKEFMEKCIIWIKENQKKSIKIEFG